MSLTRSARLPLLALAMLPVVLAGGCAQKSEKAVANGEILQCFHRFSDALDEGDGTAAAAELSLQSVKYFEQLRAAALSCPEEELQAWPIDLRLEVLKLRGRMNGDELQALRGRELAGHYIASGWMNTELLKSISLSNVIHTKRGAEARYSDRHGESKSRLIFRKEGDAWTFDLSATRWMQQVALQNVMEKRNLTERELVARVLKEALGDRSLEELWQPMLVPATADMNG